jgi:hypothetical protein
MPPSEIDGKAYRLVGGDLLKPVEIASLAEVGFSGLGQPRSDANPAMQPVHDGQRCERWVNEAMERASSGNRNDVGLWLACQLRDGGLPLEAAKPPMLEYAKNVLPGGHPYTTEEALATLESAYRRDPREPAAAPVSGLHIRRQRETRNQLVFTELSDLLIEQPEEVPWIVDELLPAGGSSILAGEPKAGKSTAARSLMLAVVEGGDFAGRSCQPCPVLYLCLEDKRSEVQKHFQAMTGTGQMQRENIYIHTGLAPLNRDESLRQLEDCIEAKKAKLLVIDVLQRFVRITDPNNYGEVSAIMEPLTDLARRSGCHILSLHHAGKGQGRTGRTGISRVLGSTAFAGAVDTAMFYSRKRGDRTLEASHLRYGRELPETTMILDPKTRRIVEGASYAERGEEAIEGEILDTLGKAGQPMTEEEIRTAVGGDRGKVGRVLRAMRVIGKVGHKGEGKPKHPYLYSFPVLPISTNEQRAVEDQQGTQNRAA